jgi:hypothetical protein
LFAFAGQAASANQAVSMLEQLWLTVDAPAERREMRFDLPDGRQERPTGLVVGFCSQFRGEGEPAFYGPKPPYAEAERMSQKGTRNRSYCVVPAAFLNFYPQGLTNFARIALTRGSLM